MSRSSTQPARARGTKLPLLAAVAALFALLALAPLASAASDPIGSSGSSSVITLNNGFLKKLKKNDVKVLNISPAKKKGKRLKMTVKSGSLDPTTGKGTLTLGGGIKFKAGKKTAPVKALSLNTSNKSLSGKVANKKMKVASLAGVSFARDGFGTVVTVNKLKLTKSAAKQLNKKLGFSGKSGKKHKRATTSSKDSNAVFKANQVMGSSRSNAQPTEVALLPTGNVNLATSLATLGKLAAVRVEIERLGGTTEPASLPSPTYAFPISGGALSPTASAGTVQTSGGLKLVQKLQTGAESFLTTNITLGNFWFDFAAKTVSVEVVAESNAVNERGEKPLNLGNLGRSSIADVSLTGATVTSNSTARTITVENASATLQVVSAEVLNGFVSVYKGYAEAVTFEEVKLFEELVEGKTPEEAIEAGKAAAKAAGEEVAKNEIKSGDPLGTISFTAQTQ
jgi:hypothetical protein